MKRFEYHGRIITANSLREAALKVLNGRMAVASKESKPWDLTPEQVAKAQAKVNELFKFLRDNGMQLCYDYDGGPLFYVASSELEGCRNTERGSISEDELDDVVSAGKLKTDGVWFSGSEYPFKYIGNKTTASFHGRRVHAASSSEEVQEVLDKLSKQGKNFSANGHGRISYLSDKGFIYAVADDHGDGDGRYAVQITIKGIGDDSMSNPFVAKSEFSGDLYGNLYAISEVCDFLDNAASAFGEIG